MCNTARRRRVAVPRPQPPSPPAQQQQQQQQQQPPPPPPAAVLASATSPDDSPVVAIAAGPHTMRILDRTGGEAAGRGGGGGPRGAVLCEADLSAHFADGECMESIALETGRYVVKVLGTHGTALELELEMKAVAVMRVTVVVAAGVRQELVRRYCDALDEVVARRPCFSSPSAA